MSTPRSGEHERRLAIGSIAQQGAQVFIALSSLALITVLGRRLELAAFGTYALFVSIASYLLFAHNSVEAAAVKLLSAAPTQEERDRVFTTAVVMYAAWAFLGGLVVAVGGLALPGALGVPADLHDEVRLGAVLMGAATFVGWPLKAYRDVLRSAQVFRRVAAADAIGYGVMAGASVALAFTGAPLWTLIAVGGAIPLFMGAAAAGFVLAAKVPARFRPRLLERREVRSFTGLSWYLLVMNVADLVIYSLDRVILALFKSAAVVGLYEGPVRAHNLVRQTAGTMVFTVLPAASRYEATGDVQRTRDLLVRGTRYVLAMVVPLVVVLASLASPLLGAWLGPGFREGAVALTLLAGYWLINANTVVAGPMLVAHGHAAWLARYGWMVALTNLSLSLALTPPLGLDGVVLGTVIPYALAFPVFMRFVLRKLPVSLSDLWREAWLPAYATGAALGLALVAVRLAVSPEGIVAIAGIGAAGLAVYWLAFFRLWLRPNERQLMGDVVRGMLRAA